MDNKDLKNRIMRRIYAIWFFRKVAPAVFLYMPFLAGVALRETAREFFVAKVAENFLLALSDGFGATMRFVFSALGHTPVMPVLIILVSLAVFALFFKKLVKNLRDVRMARSF